MANNETNTRRRKEKHICESVIEFYENHVAAPCTIDILHFCLDVERVLVLKKSQQFMARLFETRGLYPLSKHFEGLNHDKPERESKSPQFLNYPPVVQQIEVTDKYLKGCNDLHSHHNTCIFASLAETNISSVPIPGEAYFIIDPLTGDIKIGCGDAEQRLAEANGTMRSPRLPKCKLMHSYYVTDKYAEEYYLHEKFAEHRISPDREWFFGDRTLMCFVENLQKEQNESSGRTEEDEEQA